LAHPKVAPLIWLYLREAYTLIGQPRWRAPVQLTQVVVSDLDWIGSHIRMLHRVPLWMPVGAENWCSRHK